jgi:hypothetical protein
VDAAGGPDGASDGASDANSSDAGASAIAFVQVAAAEPPGGASGAAATFAQPQGAGDLVVVAVGWAGAASVSRVSDSAGTGYTLVLGPTRISAGLTQCLYYAPAIPPAAAGANTVTVTLSASVTSLELRVAEYSGLSTTAPLDTSAGLGGRSTSATSGIATTSTAPELLFGTGITQGSFGAAGSLYTLRKITPSGSGIIEDRIVDATGTYSADALLVSSAYYVMQFAAFR